jgi:hypothetical protein
MLRTEESLYDGRPDESPINEPYLGVQYLLEAVQERAVVGHKKLAASRSSFTSR